MRRFVVVEGPIGVGKTTLCRLLESQRGAELVLEPHEDNPFLEPFYRDPDRYALPVQISFLLTRFQQQDRVQQLSLFHEWVVADYLFEKDRLFAEKTLSEADLATYDAIARALGAKVPTPDLIVVLGAPIPVLLGRIAQRGIDGEERVTAGYLRDLIARYEKLWSSWDRCPILHIDNSEVDYANDPEAAAAVLARIDAVLAGESPDAPPGPDADRWPGLFDGLPTDGGATRG